VFRRDNLRREISFSVVDLHPAPVFVKNLQEDRIKQGVGGGQSGPVNGSVPEKWVIGARIKPGFGMVPVRKKGVAGGVFLKGFTA
jgi:hypothetical protein